MPTVGRQDERPDYSIHFTLHGSMGGLHANDWRVPPRRFQVRLNGNFMGSIELMDDGNWVYTPPLTEEEAKFLGEVAISWYQ